jgi:hypothetical protein
LANGKRIAVGDGNVRDLGGREGAELFGADDTSQARHCRFGRARLVDLWRPRRRRSSPRDLWDVHKGTFDYLRENEPMSLLVLTLHCHFGGRPMITSFSRRS